MTWADHLLSKVLGVKQLLTHREHYLMEHVDRGRALFVEIPDHIPTANLNARKTLRGEQRHDQPLELVEIRKNMRPVDYVGCGLVGITLISERMRDVLVRNEVSGWDTYPVDVHTVKGDPIPGYRGLIVNGRTGPILWDERTPIWMKAYAKGVPPMEGLRGIPVDMSSWDGSDIFVESGRATHIFVTSRLKTIIERSKLTNIQFTPPDELEQLYLEDRDGTSFTWPPLNGD